MAEFPRPYLVGIAGGTGSGKTTVAHKLVERLPRGSAICLTQDAYYRHRIDLTPAEREQINFDHPDSLENALLVQHLRALMRGETIEMPQYDYATHLRKEETVTVRPHPVIVVEGILLLADPELRAELELKIFVDTDADIRVLRRVRRDMDARGRTFEQVRDQYYESVRPMHIQFVEPSKRHADVIVPEGGKNEIALDMVLTQLRSMIGIGPVSDRPPAS
jgi:uridine kinase